MTPMRRKWYILGKQTDTPDFHKLHRETMDRSNMEAFLHSSVFLRMNAVEKEKIGYFLESPGNEEFLLFRQLLGKTPAQVRSTMIEEFIRRFHLTAYAKEIEQALPFRRSWRELDVAMAAFAGAMGVEDHLLFWDKMRYVLAALPQRKEYSDKYADRHALELDGAKEGWRYYTCKFCWRIVPRNPELSRKNKLFCFAHDLPARHSTYRKHDRLYSRMFGERRSVVKKLTDLIAGYPSEEDMHKAVLAHLLAPNERLPRLAAYLSRIGHDGTPESLLWAFHGPVSDEMDVRYKEALGGYIQYQLTAKAPFDLDQPPPFIFSIDELSRAEAWLTLLDSDGRRKKTNGAS